MNSNNVVSREMRLKILYTFDIENSTTCLTRSSSSVMVKMIADQDIGVIGLVTCARAIASASPEILASSESFDYAVYSTDYAEPDSPLVGHGMLSWILSTHTQEERITLSPKFCDSSVFFDENSISSAFVVGRVCTNMLSVFSRDSSPTLEVRLRLKPVTSSSQADYIRSIKLYQEIATIITEASSSSKTSFDHVAWAEFLSSNSNINSLIKQRKTLEQQQRLQQIQMAQVRRRPSSNHTSKNSNYSTNLNGSVGHMSSNIVTHPSSNLNNCSPWVYNHRSSNCSSPPPSSPPTFPNESSYTPSVLPQTSINHNFMSPNKPYIARLTTSDGSTSPTEVSPVLSRPVIAQPAISQAQNFQASVTQLSQPIPAFRPSIKEYIQLLDKQKSLSEKAKLVPDNVNTKSFKGRFEKSKKSPNNTALTPESPDDELTSTDKKKTAKTSEPSLKRKDNITKDLYEDILAGRPPKFCENCGAIHTPAWRKANHKIFYENDSTLKTLSSEELNNLRRDSEGRTYYLKQFILCNSCGIYYKDKGHMRPESLWDVKKNASDLTKVVEKIQNLKQFQDNNSVEFVGLIGKPRNTIPASSPIGLKSKIAASLKRNTPREFGEVQSSPVKRINSFPIEPLSNVRHLTDFSTVTFSAISSVPKIVNRLSLPVNHSSPDTDLEVPRNQGYRSTSGKSTTDNLVTNNLKNSPINSSTPLDEFTPLASTVASSPPTSVGLEEYDHISSEYNVDCNKKKSLPLCQVPGTPPRVIDESVDDLFITPRTKNVAKGDLFLTPQNENSPMKWLSRALNGGGGKNIFHSDPSFHSPNDFETFMNEAFSSPTTKNCKDYRIIYGSTEHDDQLNSEPVPFPGDKYHGGDQTSAVLTHPSIFYQKTNGSHTEKKNTPAKWSTLPESSSNVTSHTLDGRTEVICEPTIKGSEAIHKTSSKGPTTAQNLMVDFHEFLS